MVGLNYYRHKIDIKYYNYLSRKNAEEEREKPGSIKDYNRAYDKSDISEDNWGENNQKLHNKFIQHCTPTIQTNL